MNRLGLYCGARNVQGVKDFENWLGQPIPHVVDFIDGSTWQSIEAPTWWLDGWRDTGYDVELSIPIIPQGGGSIQEGARGAYNSHFAVLAANLVDRGFAAATLRLGWEFNGSWFKWSAKDDPRSFALYWVQIVKAMRGVPGQAFKFDWCPTLGKASVEPDRAYPGDAFVDYIGADVYDQSWSAGNTPESRWLEILDQPYGLAWQAQFAAVHLKKLTFPEWGLTDTDHHGGGDTPSFIRRMFHWIRTHPVAFASYFQYDAGDGQHRLAHFPKSQAKFKELFG